MLIKENDNEGTAMHTGLQFFLKSFLGQFELQEPVVICQRKFMFVIEYATRTSLYSSVLSTAAELPTSPFVLEASLS